MLLAQQTYQLAQQDNTPTSTMEQVQLAWYNALDSDQPSHYSDLSRIRQTGKYAQAVCQAVARNPSNKIRKSFIIHLTTVE
jgi:mannitol-1-phosphate/altronate dehydrogenase